MRRSRHSGGSAQSLGYLPYEIFLDGKNEATDYTRIVSKVDVTFLLDKFNHLRLPQQIDWPTATDDNGMPIEHLRLHQDLISVSLPQAGVAATSKHFAALFNTVFKLCFYRDPQHAARSLQIDKFNLAFDRKDRDLPRTIIDLWGKQQYTVELRKVIRKYDARIDSLSKGALDQLLLLRIKLADAEEQLYTDFEAISVSIKREKARASSIQSTRFNLRVGAIAWQSLSPDLRPFIQLELQHLLFSKITNKDGSTDQALRVQEARALNSSPDAFYSEVLTRLDTAENGRRADPVLMFTWSVTNPVGGIPILTETECFFHPLRLGIEESVMIKMRQYIVPERTTWRTKKEPKRKKKSQTHDGNALVRSISGASIASLADEDEHAEGDDKSTSVDDARIMQDRAKSRKNFHSVIVRSTLAMVSFQVSLHLLTTCLNADRTGRPDNQTFVALAGRWQHDFPDPCTGVWTCDVLL
jgi:hypothetical protein